MGGRIFGILADFRKVQKGLKRGFAHFLTKFVGHKILVGCLLRTESILSIKILRKFWSNFRETPKMATLLRPQIPKEERNSEKGHITAAPNSQKN